MSLRLLLSDLDEAERYELSMVDKVVTAITRIVEEKDITYLVALPPELIAEITDLADRYRVTGEMFLMSSSNSRDLSPLLEEFNNLRDSQK